MSPGKRCTKEILHAHRL